MCSLLELAIPKLCILVAQVEIALHLPHVAAQLVCAVVRAHLVGIDAHVALGLCCALLVDFAGPVVVCEQARGCALRYFACEVNPSSQRAVACRNIYSTAIISCSKQRSPFPRRRLQAFLLRMSRGKGARPPASLPPPPVCPERRPGAR